MALHRARDMSCDHHAHVTFRVAFVFGCDLIQNESEVAKVNWRPPGERLWIGYSTSLSSAAVLMAAALRAMRWAGEILFSCVK